MENVQMQRGNSMAEYKTTILLVNSLSKLYVNCDGDGDGDAGREIENMAENQKNNDYMRIVKLITISLKVLKEIVLPSFQFQ